jgi:hypothetical protein
MAKCARKAGTEDQFPVVMKTRESGEEEPIVQKIENITLMKKIRQLGSNVREAIVETAMVEEDQETLK